MDQTLGEFQTKPETRLLTHVGLKFQWATQMKARGKETEPEESGNKDKTVIISKRQKLGKEVDLRIRK